MAPPRTVHFLRQQNPAAKLRHLAQDWISGKAPPPEVAADHGYKLLAVLDGRLSFPEAFDLDGDPVRQARARERDRDQIIKEIRAEFFPWPDYTHEQAGDEIAAARDCYLESVAGKTNAGSKSFRRRVPPGLSTSGLNARFGAC